MGKYAGLGAVGLDLAEDDVVGVKRCADGIEVNLIAGATQNLRVADDRVATTALTGKPLHHVVRQTIAETGNFGIARFVIETHDGDNRLLPADWTGAQPMPRGESEQGKKWDCESDQHKPLLKPGRS